MTAAIYARYSSDLQSDRSIEDQIELAKSYAAREGLIVTAFYEDRALSGSSLQGRPGLARLLRDAAERLFTHVIVESLDRLSRDQADLATLYKRLTFLGIEIREVHGGKATPLNTAVRGLVGAIYLADLADKTRRGLAGNVREGKSAGGRAYGYRPVPGQAGALAIVDHEADTIRRIHDLYAAGESPRAIAGLLNAERVPPPRGSKWNASTIHGNRQRATGILLNPLYLGDLVWNRVRMVKDPDTGRRVSRVNPEHQWQRRSMPDLRIVPEALEKAVEARRRALALGGYTLARKPRHMLSGLLRCHCCGGSLVVRDRKAGRTRVECSTHKESRTCGNGRVYVLERIETAVVGALRREMEDPRVIPVYVAEYNAERRRLAAGRASTRSRTEKRLADVTGELDRLTTWLVKGVIDGEREAPRIMALRSEEKELKAELAAGHGAGVVTLHPVAITRFREQLDGLAAAIGGSSEAAAALRTLVHRVTVEPGYALELEGSLAALTENPTHHAVGGVKMVAGGRVAPCPTFLLRIAA